MAGKIQLLLPVVFPILMGIIVVTAKGLRNNRKGLCRVVSVGLVVSWLLVLWALTVDSGGLAFGSLPLQWRLPLRWMASAVCLPG